MRKLFVLFFLSLTFNCCDFYDLKIINNAAYSIGLVGNYSPPSDAYVLYSFNASGHLYQNGYNDGLHGYNVPSSGVHIGNEFMVQYDSINPTTSRMLFSYPLKDTADYKKYVQQFKTTPPGYPSP